VNKKESIVWGSYGVATNKEGKKAGAGGKKAREYYLKELVGGSTARKITGANPITKYWGGKKRLGNYLITLDGSPMESKIASRAL